MKKCSTISARNFSRLVESQMEPIPAMPDFYVGSWFHDIVRDWQDGIIDDAEYFGLAEFLNEEPTLQFRLGHVLWDNTGRNKALIPAICAYVGQAVMDTNEDSPEWGENWEVFFPCREEVLAAMANLM